MENQNKQIKSSIRGTLFTLNLLRHETENHQCALLSGTMLVSNFAFAESVPETATTTTVTESVAAATEESEPTKWEKVLEKLPKLSGYLQTGWNYNSVGDGSSSFQAKRLRLIMDGNVVKNVSFRLQIEAFNGIAGSTNGNGQKNLQVMDALSLLNFKSIPSTCRPVLSATRL